MVQHVSTPLSKHVSLASMMVPSPGFTPVSLRLLRLGHFPSQVLAAVALSSAQKNWAYWISFAQRATAPRPPPPG